MQSQTIDFFKYLLGLRPSYTSDTKDELDFLVTLGRGKSCIVEVGVYEGVASRRLSENMDPSGKLYLIDPYFPELKLEKLFNVSFREIIARRTVGNSTNRAHFLRKTSVEAADALADLRTADLIFIDARHDYDSVREDFQLWAPKVAPGGVIAFHDSHMCPARPEICEDDGPVKLCREIATGQYGAWIPAGIADSITSFRNGGGGNGNSEASR